MARDCVVVGRMIALVSVKKVHGLILTDKGSRIAGYGVACQLIWMT